MALQLTVLIHEYILLFGTIKKNTRRQLVSEFKIIFMKKYFHYFILLVTIISGCNKNNIEFQKLILENQISSVEIDYLNMQDGYRFIKETKNTLIIANDSILFIYDFIQNEMLNEIKIPRNFHKIYYHNIDSIFILQNPYHTHVDSMLCLINSEGIVTRFYSFNNQLLLDTNSNLKAHPTDLVFADKKLYVSLNRKVYKLVGDDVFLKNKTPLLVFFNENNTLEAVDLYDYPDLSIENQFSPVFFKQYLNKFDKKNILLSFSYSPTILKINSETNKYQSFYMKSFVLDTLPLRKHLTMTQPAYYNININEESALIIRTIIYGKSKNKIGYLCFDKNFNRIGEFVDNDTLRFAFEKNDEFYFFFLNYKKNTVSLNKYNYQFKVEDKEIWLKENELINLREEVIAECQISIKEDSIYDLSPYLKKHIQDISYSVVIVPVQFACPGCIDYALMQYFANQDYYSARKIYLIAVGEGGDMVKSKLINASIDIENQHILLDSTSDYFNFQKGYTNIQYLIIENNEITFNRIYKPNELNDFGMKDLKNYCDAFIKQ